MDPLRGLCLKKDATEKYNRARGTRSPRSPCQPTQVYPKHGRRNVKRRVPISGRTILVSYEKRDDETVVVNAMEVR